MKGRRKIEMCKYCEEDKRKKRDCIINTPIVSLRIIRNNGFNALAIKSYNLEKHVVDSYQTINYCPKCRKEAGRVKRYASGYWYQFIIPRRLTLPPTRIYRWLNFFWRLKDKEESYDK